MIAYHDKEWGIPLHDDRRLFEFLVLEGAQAGLSWMTILRKRDAYRRAFCDFDPEQVAGFSSSTVTALLNDQGIVRNRRKIESVIRNAAVVQQIRKEAGSFDRYLWSFVEGRPIVNAWKAMSEIPSQSDRSIRISKDLLRRGASFVGPTICYALMQATGLVNDHLVSCFRSPTPHPDPPPQGAREIRPARRREN